MKTLVALALVVLATSGAFAQNYQYEPCSYQFGLFFSTDQEERVFTEERTNIDYVQFTTFYMHLVVMNSPTNISAYEFTIAGIPPGVFIETFNVVPGTGQTNIGTSFMQICAFGFPQPNTNGYVYLGNWGLFALGAPQTVEFQILPSEPSSILGDGPAIVVDQVLWRPNFTPDEYTGCNEPLAPGDFPPYVATTYGPGVTAIESVSLTSVKALFR